MSGLNIDENLAEKRQRLIESYAASVKNDTAASAAAAMNESAFNALLLSVTSSQLDDNDRLVETSIRYALAYVEEFDYGLKLFGVRLLERIVEQLAPTRLKCNMRADLIRETVARYVNDKESLEFLDKSNEFMIKLLGIIETRFNTNEHYFKQTSSYIDSALSNCYMSTNAQVKAIYLKHIKSMTSRLGPCACRHLDKLLTVLFDAIELAKLNAQEFGPATTSSSTSPTTTSTTATTTTTTTTETTSSSPSPSSSPITTDGSTTTTAVTMTTSVLASLRPALAARHLILVSLDLMHTLVQACFYRIHSHSRRLIQFLLKLVYAYSAMLVPACLNNLPAIVSTLRPVTSTTTTTTIKTTNSVASSPLERSNHTDDEDDNSDGDQSDADDDDDQDDQDELDEEPMERRTIELSLNYDHFRLIVCLKCVRLVKTLFSNDRIRCSLYDDFKLVKADAHLNRNFLKLIENI